MLEEKIVIKGDVREANNYYIVEADGHIIGEDVENLFFEKLGIKEHDKVYLKKVGNHVEIGAIKIELIR